MCATRKTRNSSFFGTAEAGTVVRAFSRKDGYSHGSQSVGASGTAEFDSMHTCNSGCVALAPQGEVKPVHSRGVWQNYWARQFFESIRLYCLNATPLADRTVFLDAVNSCLPR